MASDDMLAWLRSTIEGDKAAAEADRDDQVEWAAEYMTGLGPSGGAASVHIRLQAPLHTIARCTAELALMDLHVVTEEVEYNGQQGTVTGCPTCPEGTWFPCPTLDALAKTRRHRPGFNPAWATPKPVVVGISEERV